MLQDIVLLLGQINECFACFNPWIFVPPQSLDRRTSWLHALCLTLSYAAIETIAIRGMQASDIPPWIFAWCLSPLTGLSTYIFICLQDAELYDDLTIKKDKEKTSKYSQRHQVRNTVALLLCVITAAVINASLLLFGQSLYASWIQQRYHVTHVFGPLAVVVNLACRYCDYEIYKRSGRPLALRELSCYSVYGPAVIFLAILFVARLYIRILAGVEPFLAFHVLGADQADLLYPEPI
jgi:hypothetical protein